MALLLIFFFFILLPTVFSNPFQYQILQLKSLPISHHVTPADEIEIGDTSISLQLHHIDSLISLNASPESLFNLRLQRDAKRVNCLFWRFCPFWRDNGGFNSSVFSDLAKATGEYYVRFGIGIPPVYSHVIVDTGSDITWIQCSPCVKCYGQFDQLFDPTRSTSYSSVECNSKLCHRLANSDCDNQTNSCMYKVKYGDGSITTGDFATETLTFGKKKIPNFALGCGHHNEGRFSGAAAGILGLGRGNLSFTNQIGPTFQNKFSYCLVDHSSSRTAKPSILIFGNSAISRTANYTPLLTNPIHKSFYYLDLLGFSVGGHRVLEITPQMFKIDSKGDGGVTIDSGTSVTRLNNEAYIYLREAFRYYMSELRKPVMEFALFDTCYELAGIKMFKVPDVVLHFNRADLALPAQNYFIPVDSTRTLFCFAIAASPPGKKTIIGNIQQQGFRIIHDLAGSRIGFSKYDATCEKNI